MNFTLHGVGVSRGIAIGKAHIIQRDQLDVTEYSIVEKAIGKEIARFENALLLAKQQLRAIRDHIPKTTAADIAAFIDTHLLMLEDSSLTAEPARLIRELRCNAEWALKLQRDALVTVFDDMDDAYLRTRKDDIDHVVNRIQRILLKQAPLRHEVPDSRLRDYIVISDDLAPSDTLLMQHHGIAAFATEGGGQTSHTAILARSLGIPSIVGLHQARRYIREDDILIIDGGRGVVVVNPDDSTLVYYRRLQQDEKAYFAELYKLKGTPAVTVDGLQIRLEANIELPQDFEAVARVGAVGVGLYRTEFLYMNREQPPDEEEHFATYREVLKVLGGIPVTIRTLDLGADKQIDGTNRNSGGQYSNPALGLRAIRLCLKDEVLFKPQLRAILRASAFGPVRLLIPMLSNLQELYQVLRLIEEIRAEYRERSIAFDPEMQIGGMIEVPAAAMCADIFVRHLDFLSIGTNDLIQYSIAIDRVDDEVSYLYDPLHPGVLRLIKIVIDAGEKADKPVSMCGEMAGEREFVRLLIALGLKNFSVHPAVLLEIKRIVTSSDMSALTDLGREALRCSSGMEVRALIDEYE